MQNNFFLKKSFYIFYVTVIVLVVGAFYIFKTFDKTSSDIEQLTLKSNIEYINNIANNISTMINEKTDMNLVRSLKKNKALRNRLQEDLEMFRTKRYRYIYIVQKVPNTTKFRFLLDGAKKDKSGFLESFQPFNTQQWLDTYTTKSARYFSHKEIKSLWLTYLKPIVQHNKVVGIIAIDFSLHEYNYMHHTLLDLSSTVKIFMSILLFIFIVVLIFASIDKKRVYMLKKQAQEIQNFNITLQNRVDEEVAKNREKDKQILEQSRLAQMGEMIGMIAHQWRQPINAISAASISINMRAQMETLDSKTAIETAEKIGELTQHLSKTIDDFRNFFKEAKEKQDTTYGDLVTSTLDIVGVSVKNKNITIETDIQSDIVFHTYVNELKQVLLNLIKNAEDVLKEKEIKDAFIKIEAVENRLIVRDNGGGVPKDIIEKIFDPYFSTKTLNGTGLGLYMSKTIVETHCGGTISVTNDKDGAVFCVELPFTN